MRSAGSDQAPRPTQRIRPNPGSATFSGMEVLYISSSGSVDPTRASIPWHLAVNGSIESNQTARLVLVGDAAEAVRADVRNQVEGIGVPPLRDLVSKAVERAVPVHV